MTRSERRITALPAFTMPTTSAAEFTSLRERMRIMFSICVSMWMVWNTISMRSPFRYFSIMPGSDSTMGQPSVALPYNPR